VRSVLADKPITAQVAGVVNSRLITSGSRHVLTAQILADLARRKATGADKVWGPPHGYTADALGRER
jgi:uncharacterized membrane-anchored protein